MKITLNINLNGLKTLVQYALQTNTDFLGEAYYNPTDYVIISVKEQTLYITAIYKDTVLTHMADVSYALLLDLIGELDYSTNDFKEIISHYKEEQLWELKTYYLKEFMKQTQSIDN